MRTTTSAPTRAGSAPSTERCSKRSAPASPMDSRRTDDRPRGGGRNHPRCHHGDSRRALSAGHRSRTQRALPRDSTDVPWIYGRLREVLIRPRNARRLSRGRPEGDPSGFEIVGPAAWPAIADEDTWRAVHAVLTDPSRRVQQGQRAEMARLRHPLMALRRSAATGTVRRDAIAPGHPKGPLPLHGVGASDDHRRTHRRPWRGGRVGPRPPRGRSDAAGR